MTVAELLDSPEKWTQATTACDAMGDRVQVDSPLAVRWCLVGALDKCYPNEEDYDAAYERVLSLTGQDSLQLSSWNDAPCRTFEEVRALVLKAGV